MSYDGSIRIDTSVDTTGYSAGVKSLGAMGKTAVAGLATLFAGAAASVGGLATAAVKAGSSFETAMSEVGAISGATAEEMEQLTAKAKEMGATTKFSASESAEALKYMGMAGWKTQDMLDGLPGIMNLAAASGEELGSVSDIVTDALTAFGLQAQDSAHFADVLAQASNASNTDVAMMGATFKYAAPLAGALGYSIEDVAVATGLMANAGIKAEQAGTSLRSMFTRLSKPPKDAAQAMDVLGITMTEADGSMKPLRQTLGELRAAFSGLTEEEQIQMAASLAGQEAMSGLLAIVNAGEEDFNALAESIDTADGAAQQMADTMQDNLQGDITILQSALEGLGIQIYESIQEPLRAAAQQGTRSIEDISQALKSRGLKRAMDTIGDNFVTLVKHVGDFAAKAIPALVNGLATALDALNKLGPVLAGAAAGFVAFKAASAVAGAVTALSAAFSTARLQISLFTVANGAAAVSQGVLNGAFTIGEVAVGVLTGKITLATAAQWLWNAALNANPIGLVAVAVGALVGAFALLSQQTNDGKQKFEAFKAASDEIIASQEELRGQYEETQQAFADNTASIEAESTAAQRLSDDIYDLANKTKKTASEKSRLKVMVKQLNDLVPDLGLAYDEEADALNMIERETKKVIAAKKDMLLQQAYEEIALQTAKDLAQAELDVATANDQVKTATDLATAAEQRLSEGRGTVLEQMRKALGMASAEEEQLQKTTENLNAQKATRDSLSAALETQTSWLTAHAEKTEETNARIEASEAGLTEEQIKNTGILGMTVEERKAFLEDLEEKEKELAEEAKKAYEQYAGYATNAFSKIEEESGTSISKMIENLQYNQQKVKEWADNLDLLGRRGLDEGLIKQLREAGPESAATVRNLVNASDKELQKLSAVFESGTEDAINEQQRLLGLPSTVSAPSRMIDDAADEVADNRALSDAAAGAVTEAKTAMNDRVTTSKFDSVGSDIAAGVAQGIRSGTSTVARAADALVDSALAAARNAADSHSPARRFMPLGEDIDEGVAVGVERKQYTAQAARDIITEAHAAVSGLQQRLFGRYAAEASNKATVAGASQPAGAVAVQGNITVVTNLDGREVARTTAPYMAEQLAWEGGY